LGSHELADPISNQISGTIHPNCFGKKCFLGKKLLGVFFMLVKNLVGFVFSQMQIGICKSVYNFAGFFHSNKILGP
jgi:hypothetical protein